MREIKFRAFQDNEMKYQEVCGVYGTKTFLNKLYEDCNLMQYTGLKDKNGKEIYEGDIIKNIKYGGVAIIRWGLKNETYCGWTVEWINPRNDQIKYDLMYYKDLENCEIIGNIHENKDLLNEKNSWIRYKLWLRF